MSDDYSDFTKLVLDRMETNPNEFEAGSRWDTLVRGLEEYARGDMDGRYVKTLWPLEHQEIEVLMTKYRKMYLARIHKDMLKNIVSGDDLNRAQYKYDSDVTVAPLTSGVLRGASPSTLVTDHIYDANRYTTGVTDTTALYGAVVKGEGTPVNRYSLNASQLAVCKKLGMDPGQYAQQIEKYGL